MHNASFTVEDHELPVRIDKYLSEKFQGFSRSLIQKWIENNQVFLNSHRVAQCRMKVVPGDLIEVQEIPPNTETIQPENLPLDVLYEDDYMLFIHKPAGMSVHPAPNRTHGTLVNALLYHAPSLSSGSAPDRPGIVHRLDQGTGGVLVVAKDDDTHEKLSQMFQNRTVNKVYWAIVHDVPSQPEFEIGAPIQRNPGNRKKMIVHPDGKTALTRFKTLKHGLGGALLEVSPLTGRTHQIRVHLQHVGHPVVGDPLYCKKKWLHRGQLERELVGYPGFGLHAKSLSFQHPHHDEILIVEAPLPEPFVRIVEQMS